MDVGGATRDSSKHVMKRRAEQLPWHNNIWTLRQDITKPSTNGYTVAFALPLQDRQCDCRPDCNPLYPYQCKRHACRLLRIDNGELLNLVMGAHIQIVDIQHLADMCKGRLGDTG